MRKDSELWGAYLDRRELYGSDRRYGRSGGFGIKRLPQHKVFGIQAKRTANLEKAGRAILAGSSVPVAAREARLEITTLLRFLDAAGIEISDQWSRCNYARESWGRQFTAIAAAIDPLRDLDALELSSLF